MGYDEAIKYVAPRVGSDPRWAVALVTLYHEKGDDDSAVEALEPILAASAAMPPADRVTILQLAGTVYQTARPKPFTDKAYQCYKELLAINPTNLAALNQMACLCADGFSPPKVEEGLSYIRTATEIMTNNGTSEPKLDDTYGWLLILGGSPSEGVGILRKVIDRQPFPEAYYHLAEGYLRMDRPQDAQKQVNAALASIAKAQQANQPVSPVTRAKVEDLSNRVLNSLGGTSGTLP